ncbi:uncharacterized protein LOC107264227 isoform X2 [Cephus cinctus]|uniref:Uncharacterized protein LOC107264227 isoform X2 n=1 Tax=Cephus cinctus TaxID=211228 RepID=A0AAJ7BJT5_CEPCN|nr:uncharacterized protein LOC107264227 isoform X2 [Cephus cinctus]
MARSLVLFIGFNLIVWILKTVLGSHRSKNIISRNTNVIHFEPNKKPVDLDADNHNDVNNYRHCYSHPDDPYFSFSHLDDIEKIDPRSR